MVLFLVSLFDSELLIQADLLGILFAFQYHEGVRAMWLAEKGGNVYSHPYDLGAFENLTTVCTTVCFSSSLLPGF